MSQTGERDEPASGHPDRADDPSRWSAGFDRFRAAAGAHPVVFAVLVGLFAALVNAIALDRPAPWRDEAATGWVVQHSLNQIHSLSQHWDAVLVTYYYLMHAWTGMVGFSVLTLRIPSVIAVGVGAAAMVGVGRRVGGTNLGLCSGVVFALTPRITWAAVEARPYALAAATVALSLWAVLEARSARLRIPWWALWTIMATAAIYFHLWAALVIACIALATFVCAPDRRYRMWLSGSTMLVMALAVPLVLAAQRQRFQVAWLSNHSAFDSTPEQLLVDAYFPYRTAAQYITAFQSHVRIAAIAMAVIVWGMVAVALILRTVPRQALWFGLMPVVAYPVLLLLGGHVVGQSLIMDRYFAPTTPCFALLVASVLVHFPWRRVRTFLVVLLLLGSLVLGAQQRTHMAKSFLDDHEFIATTLQKHSRPGDAFVFDSSYVWSGYDGIDSGRYALALYPDVFRPLDDVAWPRPEGLDAPWPLDRPADIGAAMTTHSRIWVVKVILNPDPGYGGYLRDHDWCEDQSSSSTTHNVALWQPCVSG